jgi:hypothetical protein
MWGKKRLYLVQWNNTFRFSFIRLPSSLDDDDDDDDDATWANDGRTEINK